MEPDSHGDPVASLFEIYRGPLQRYIYRLTRNDADAEDLLQETFLRVRRAFPGFRDEAAHSTWIYRIATNVCLDFFRRQAARPAEAAGGLEALESEEGGQIDVGVAEGPVLTPEALFETSEMGECVREYVDSLPDTFRAALVLHDLEGLSNPEVAGVLGWSLEKVKMNVHRARRRLKEVLEQKCSFYRDERDVLRCERRDEGTEDDDSRS